MIYQVVFSKKALKQLQKMDKYTQRMLINWIEKNLVNTKNPFPSGKIFLDNIYRYKIGDYRLLLETENNQLTILVIASRHNKGIIKSL